MGRSRSDGGQLREPASARVRQRSDASHAAQRGDVAVMRRHRVDYISLSRQPGDRDRMFFGTPLEESPGSIGRAAR